MANLRPFPIDARLTGISLAYRNRALIAEDVLPRVPVGNQSFRYLLHTKAERFTIPSTLVGRNGRPNEVEFSASETSGLVYDYGLDDVVPNDDIASAPEGWDPLGNAVEGLSDLLALDREVRVATLLGTAATYPAGQKEQNTGTDVWEDTANSDPVTQILDAMRVPLMRPNIMIVSQLVWDRLRTHPKVVKSVQANGTDTGIIGMQAVQSLFGLDRILVGEAFVNTAKPGQAATYARAWGNDAILLHQNRLANTRSPQMTFGYTAAWMGRVAGQMAEPQTGLRGAIRVRVGESVNEIICASDCGYFIEDAATA
jgi:hypothetical protein